MYSPSPVHALQLQVYCLQQRMAPRILPRFRVCIANNLSPSRDGVAPEGSSGAYTPTHCQRRVEFRARAGYVLQGCSVEASAPEHHGTASLQLALGKSGGAVRHPTLCTPQGWATKHAGTPWRHLAMAMAMRLHSSRRPGSSRRLESVSERGECSSCMSWVSVVLSACDSGFRNQGCECRVTQNHLIEVGEAFVDTGMAPAERHSYQYQHGMNE